MNKAILVGNLTKDWELKTTPSGKMVAQNSIATNKNYTDKNGEKKSIATFHNLVIWEKGAETVSKFTKKGSKLMVVGEITNRSWEAQDGTKRNITEILVNEFEFLGSKEGNRAPDPEPPANIVDFGDSDAAAANQDEIKVENIPF